MVAEPDNARLVVDFLNSIDIDEGIDLLAEAASYRRWAVAHGLRARNRQQAVILRDALRQLVHTGDATLPDITLTARVGSDGTPQLVGTDVAAAVLAAAVRLTTQDQWRRLKLCPNPVCLEAFWDRSKNRSRTWCDMNGCGNLAKTRAYRTRRRTSHR